MVHGVRVCASRRSSGTDLPDSFSELSSDVDHGCIELLVGIDRSFTWDVVLFT